MFVAALGGEAASELGKLSSDGPIADFLLLQMLIGRGLHFILLYNPLGIVKLIDVALSDLTMVDSIPCIVATGLTESRIDK